MAALTTGLKFPHTAFADTQVRPGEVTVLEGRTDAGNRHVLILAGLRPHPWTAFGRGRRKTNHEPYAIWKASTRLTIMAALRKAAVVAYAPTATLGLAMSFGATKRKVGDERQTTSVLSWDVRNLEKSFEDVMKGSLYADDKQIRFTGPGSAIDTSADFMCAHVWEGGLWQPAWDAYTIPEV